MLIKDMETKKLGFFRFKQLDEDYLLTNDIGDFAYLHNGSFSKLLKGGLDERSAEYKLLKEKAFIRDDSKCNTVVERYRLRNAFFGLGTSLHIIVVTLRCDHACIYCHASARNIKASDLDMDIETARKVVDRIFESPSPTITIEFQGGEPLLNFDTIKFIIEYAQEKNKTLNKNLLITLVTNFSKINDERLSYLLKNKISLCTSIDGPRKLHNKNRISLYNMDSYNHTIKWFKRAQRQYLHRIRYRPNALTTITKYSLSYPKEIVDEYVKLGLEGIHLRPLNPFGLAKKSWEKIGYTAAEFIDFYRIAFDYIIELNRKGRMFYERAARVFLMKIFSDTDPGYFEIRSPCGAGIGQLAYNFNGDVYTCDEGRMMSRTGDESFRLGNVMENCYRDVVSTHTVKAICVSSILDILPGCSTCVYKPYCGVCPIYNYTEGGNIFCQTPNNERCKINTAILDILFKKIKDKKNLQIFKKWVNRGPRII